MNRILLLVIVAQAVLIVFLIGRDPAARSTSERGIPGEPRPTERPARPLPPPPAEAIGLVAQGVVWDAAGAALEGAAVAFVSPERHPRRDRCDRDGRYVVAGLVAGTWTLRVEKSGYLVHEETVELAAHDRRTVTLHRAAKMLVRMLTPGGRDLNEALEQGPLAHEMKAHKVIALVTREAPPAAFAPTEERFARSALGRFRYETRELEARTPLPAHVSLVLRHLVLATQFVEKPIDELRFVVSVEDVLARLATVRLRVEPARNAWVYFGDHQFSGTPRKPGDDGRLVLEHVLPGIRELTIHGPREQPRAFVRIEPGENDLGTWQLGEPRVLRLRFRDPNGKPVVPAVQLVDLERRTFPQLLTGPRGYGVDDEKIVSLSGLGPRRYLVIAQHGTNGRALLPIEAQEALPDVVDVALERGTRVLLEGDVGRDESFLVEVRTEAGLPVLVGRVSHERASIVEFLLPGRYSVHRFEGAVERTRSEFEVAKRFLAVRY